MKIPNYIYLYFLSGIVFLVLAGIEYINESSNLAPVFTSIGFAIISISCVLLTRQQNCKNKADCGD